VDAIFGYNLPEMLRSITKQPSCELEAMLNERKPTCGDANTDFPDEIIKPRIERGGFRSNPII
jgi:hypothetical protein